jgi:hypothetical protein
MQRRLRTEAQSARNSRARAREPSSAPPPPISRRPQAIAFVSGFRSDFNRGVLHVRRAKAGTPATHPLTGRELRALRRLRLVQRRVCSCPSARRRSRSTAIRKWLSGRAPGRSSASRRTPTCCGTPAATSLPTTAPTHTIQAYDIRHTVRYTELSPVRFRVGASGASRYGAERSSADRARIEIGTRCTRGGAFSRRGACALRGAVTRQVCS